GEIDVAIFASQLDTSFLQHALGAPGLRLMNVAQAEAIAKTVPGLKHLVLSRGLISLTRDIPNSDVDLLASRNSLLVRKDLHPALQYLLLKAMREVHWPPDPFNRLGEFPAEQPNDLPLSPTAEAFYRSGPSFWQRYTSFWLTSLLTRIIFFVIPVVAALVPVIGFAPRFYRWLYLRRINQLHRALGNLESELAHGADGSRLGEYQARLAEIESAVRMFKVARPSKATRLDAFVAVPLPQRYPPFATRARELLAVGRFGPLSHIYVRLNRPGPARYQTWDCAWMLDPAEAGGGCLRNLGPHG